jgi:hypothetical protein
VRVRVCVRARVDFCVSFLVDSRVLTASTAKMQRMLTYADVCCTQPIRLKSSDTVQVSKWSEGVKLLVYATLSF